MYIARLLTPSLRKRFTKLQTSCAKRLVSHIPVIKASWRRPLRRKILWSFTVLSCTPTNSNPTLLFMTVLLTRMILKLSSLLNSEIRLTAFSRVVKPIFVLFCFNYLNSHGLVGIRTQDTAKDFRQPLVIAYFQVDYTKY